MSWLDKLLPSISKTESKRKKRGTIPKGVWSQCPNCEATLYHETLTKNADVCPKCGHHLRISARRRIELFLDAGIQEELGADLEPKDILKFKDLKRYRDRLQAAQKETGENDALVVIQGELKGLKVVVAAFEFGFIGGSMGAVVGEKFVQGVNSCIRQRAPLICFSTSGGA